MGQAPAPHDSDKCVVPEHDRRLSPVQRMRKSCHVRVCFLEGLTLVSPETSCDALAGSLSPSPEAQHVISKRGSPHGVPQRTCEFSHLATVSDKWHLVL